MNAIITVFKPLNCEGFNGEEAMIRYVYHPREPQYIDCPACPPWCEILDIKVDGQHPTLSQENYLYLEDLLLSDHDSRGW